MKKLLFFIAFMATALFMVKKYVPSNAEVHSQKPENAARMRVKAMLDGWKEGGARATGAEQVALSQWAIGKDVIPDRDELERAMDKWDRWRRERGLYGDLKSYEIVDMKRIEQASTAYTLVQLRLNDREQYIGVPDGERPIFWAERPR